MKRLALLLAIAVVGLNVWTGSPLMALWIGSRVQGSSQPSMGAVFLVAVLVGVFSFALLKLLNILGAEYDELVGRPPAIREHTPWLRSLRGERPLEQPEGVRASAAEAIAVGMVLMAVAAFEVWFFFFSSSSIPQ